MLTDEIISSIAARSRGILCYARIRTALYCFICNYHQCTETPAAIACGSSKLLPICQPCGSTITPFQLAIYRIKYVERLKAGSDNKAT
mgnify:CR=1 FL=1